MTFLLELKDDLVLISTWETASNSWYCWGSIHYDAFWVAGKYPDWRRELKKEGKVIVNAEFSLSTAFSLPPDNIS